MGKEIWKDVIGYEDLYLISNYGNVYGKKHKRILKETDNGHGYKKVILCKKQKVKNYYIHRLVAINFLPTNKDKKFINHKDGLKYNNSLNNLEWCTKSENMIHAVSLGLSKSGVNHYKAKLTEAQIHEILFSNERPTILARKFNIGYRYLREIKTGRKWKNTRKI